MIHFTKQDKDVENKIKILINKINYYDQLYYNKNVQEISDYEYDLLRESLKELENSELTKMIFTSNDIILFIY